MDIKVHDIVRFKSIHQLIFKQEMPNWVLEHLSCQEYAVVRRIKSLPPIIPIGLRGSARNERFGAFIDCSSVIEVIKPTQLVSQLETYQKNRFYPTLCKLSEVMAKFNYEWGPTGSVGFELATNIAVTNQSSDIDLVVHIPSNAVNVEQLELLNKTLLEINPNIDVQIEISTLGAAILTDIINHRDGFLLRTSSGPLLMKLENNNIDVLNV